MNHSTLNILLIVMLSPGLFLCGIVFPLQWSHLRPLMSLRLRFRLLVVITDYFQKCNISNQKELGLKVQVFRKTMPLELSKSVHK